MEYNNIKKETPVYLVLLSVIFLLSAVNIETKNTTVYNTLLQSDTLQQETHKSYIVTEDGAWCWFADPRALHYENPDGSINSTYTGYIDVHGNIKATQHNFITGKTNEILIRSYFQPDDHDNPSFLVLPDERIMIFYSRHTDEACFYYRVSKNAGDITILGPEMKIKTRYNTTYPSPFILSADNKHFYLCWRGIKWHPTIARYTIPDAQDQVKQDWGPYQMIQSTAARPYCKYYSNGIDKIYLAYTTGHPDNEYPNYIYFNYIDINTLQLKDISGTVLSTISKGAHQVNKTNHTDLHPLAVADSPADQRDWIWQTSIDKNGLPVIAMVRISKDKATHDYYYAKWTGTRWRKTFLAHGGGHFHQSEGLELCYSGGMAIDDSNTNVVYCSVPVLGTSGEIYEIVKYTLNEAGAVASSEQITSNSPLNNVRPYIIANSGNSPLKLLWMYGNYYDWIVSSSYPEGFSTAIHSNYSFPSENIDLTNGLVLKENFDKPVAGTATVKDGELITDKSTYAIFKAPSAEFFSISLTPCIAKDAYEGVIFKMGNLEYGLNGASLKPYMTIDGISYNSTNYLTNSDSWQTQNRATGGKWWEPVKLGYFNLTLTRENNVLTIYRDGLIDQVLETDDIVLKNVVLGGFNGRIKNCRIYNRALNQQEVKKLAEKKAYLLTYFKDDTHSLHFALSSDGYTFTDVNNGNPVVGGDTIASQKGIRDPHITRGPDGAFYVAMTDLHIFGKQKGYRDTQWERDAKKYDWGNNRGFVLMKSFDLIHWTHHNVHIANVFPGLKEVGCAWAPQTIHDPEADKMMLYFTMRISHGRTKLYYAYTDNDFTTLVTAPKILFEYPDSTIQVLDADITPLPDGRFCMMYVAQEKPTGGIKMAFSKYINRSYKYIPEWTDLEPGSCEAPNVWKRGGEEKWVLMYDIFSILPHNFGFCETSDFSSFKDIGHFNEGVLKTTNFTSPKHGSIIQLTEKEAKNLSGHWNLDMKF